MTEKAAGPPGHASREAPDPATPAETPGPDPAAGAGQPPPGDGGWPSPGGVDPGWYAGQRSAPPPGTAAFTSRYGLLRPRQGRYLAGVCAALGRATGTDPVLWRVLLAVLGFFGGIGILVYVTAWLIIPAEGDTASPVESMLGRGRSSMSPMTVLLLGVLVAVLFGFIVTDAFRAVLLGVAILICGALLLNRATPPAGAVGPMPPSVPPMAYRPPFAPHGPYAGPYPPGGPPSPPPVVPPPPIPPHPPIPPGPAKPPKPPRERSQLGSATLSMIFVALGVVAVLDLTNAVAVSPSTYFAAALFTIALGLLVGAGLGRARWLIALGLVGAVALGVATLAESYEAVGHDRGSVNWTPVRYDALADRYGTRFGDATLDLTQVDFTGQEARVTAAIEFGQLRVILPDEVDTTVVMDVTAGEARAFGNSWSGFERPSQEVTDLGTDGPGGGTLRLYLQVRAGEAEVIR